MDLTNKLVEYFEFNKSINGAFIYFDKMPNEKQTAKHNTEHTILPDCDDFKIDIQIQIEQNKHISLRENENPVIKKTEKKIHSMSLKDLSHIKTLEELNAELGGCACCGLGAMRNKLVFGSGNPNADIMVIGEAPGADEDMQGLPFVGRSGKLLTDILQSVNFSRDEVYIANICKCRPPGNRKPTTEEIYFCEHYLLKQIEIINPKFILALGLTAAAALFKIPHKMSEIRGKILDYHGIKTLTTYHPAALLRNPSWKRSVWEDVQLLRHLYDESSSNS